MATMATLRDGTEVFAPLVTGIALSLRGLVQNQPLAFYDAVTVARDPSYRPFGSNDTLLKSLGLIEPDGSMHAETRRIILALTEGDDLDMRMVNPYAG